MKRRHINHDKAQLERELLAAQKEKVSAEIEKIVLNAPEDPIDVDGKICTREVHPRHADRRIRLVDRTIGGDAKAVLAHALTAAKRCGPVVAGASVDLVQNDHGRAPSVSG